MLSDAQLAEIQRRWEHRNIGPSCFALFLEHGPEDMFVLLAEVRRLRKLEKAVKEADADDAVLESEAHVRIGLDRWEKILDALEAHHAE